MALRKDLELLIADKLLLTAARMHKTKSLLPAALGPRAPKAGADALHDGVRLRWTAEDEFQFGAGVCASFSSQEG